MEKFSYSTKPILRGSNIIETIDFDALIKLIKNHPCTETVAQVRKLRAEGKDDECRDLKRATIPWLTPNCILKKRKLEKDCDFKENFIRSSRYIYYDIDADVSTTEKLKKEFIENYGNIVALVSKSVSARGISILVRINRYINSKNDFNVAYDYIQNNYFPLIKFDDNVKILGAAWYLPYDADVYFNTDNVIEIPDDIFSSISSYDVYSPPSPPIHLMSYSEEDNSNENLILETKVDFEGDYYIWPIPILSIHFPEKIEDGSKHKVFKRVLHDFIELNPKSNYKDALDFIAHLNNRFCEPKMNFLHLKSVVRSQYESIKANQNYINKSKRQLRVIHYRKKYLIPPDIRKGLSNSMRGLLDRALTHKKIYQAISYLLDEYGSYSHQEICDLTKISRSTIKRHIHKTKNEFEKEFTELTNKIQTIVTLYQLPTY